jgi:hypothetical protein
MGQVGPGALPLCQHRVPTPTVLFNNLQTTSNKIFRNLKLATVCLLGYGSRAYNGLKYRVCPPYTRLSFPQSRQSAKPFFSTVVRIGTSPPPQPQAIVPPHPLRESGWGVPIPTRGHTLWCSIYISTLWSFHASFPLHISQAILESTCGDLNANRPLVNKLGT